jgi:aspartate carbamoyltransferase catalytic subunit
MFGASLSFLDLQNLSLEKIESIFSVAEQFLKNNHSEKLTGKNPVALLFFEASTRTRLSFEMASHRLGLNPVLLDGGMKTSLEKGESIQDSILNVCAMKPSCAVIRCGDGIDLQQLSLRAGVPLINAGWGQKGHPTQALLDLFTLKKRLGSLKGKKLLILGDIKHSRVAASHEEIVHRLGLEVRYCTPEYFLPSDNKRAVFSNLKDGVEWADALLCLRSQFERHGSDVPISDGEEIRKFKEFFTVSRAVLQDFKPSGVVLHPGPVHWGFDMDADIINDPRCAVLEQVTYGVCVRQALLQLLLKGAH